MNGLERTLAFLRGEAVDQLPYHPIVMRIVGKWAKVKYRDYCLDAETHCRAALAMARAFDMDWVTVMSDPYAEAEAFGLEVEYPEDALPQHVGHVINDPAVDIDKLVVPNLSEQARMMSRVEQVRLFAELCGDTHFVVGWVEGAIAEYTDLRGLAEMCFDFFDCPDKLEQALDIIQQNALQLITAQVEAGAHCIGIGDAACSQIGPELYREHAWAREKQLVEHIHSLGAIAKLHICGDTTALVPDMVATGAEIVDIDHLATDMGSFATHLGEGQVLCGNPDPVEVVEQGTPERILSAVAGINRDTGGRTIVSAGCEITPDTSDENLRALGEAARRMDGMP